MKKRLGQITFPLLCIFICLPSLSMAISLGKIQIQSHLNQTLRATIPITGLAGTPLSALHIKLLPSMPMQNHQVLLVKLHKIHYRIVKYSWQQALIQLRSKTKILEPLLVFTLQMRSPAGRSEKHYTALLQPLPRSLAASLRENK